MNRALHRPAAADRLSDCENALELSHIALVDNAVAGGWTEREVAVALFNLARAHLKMLGGSGSETVLKANVA